MVNGGENAARGYENPESQLLIRMATCVKHVLKCGRRERGFVANPAPNVPGDLDRLLADCED
jgi:hypothetical protein